MGARGHKTASGHLSHPPRKVVRKEGVFRPTLAPRRSAGVRDIQKRSFAQAHPCWPPIKGKNSGQKKSTQIAKTNGPKK
jgi:hypothetical protein